MKVNLGKTNKDIDLSPSQSHGVRNDDFIHSSSFFVFVLLVLMRRGWSHSGQRERLITPGATVSQRVTRIRVYTSATLVPLIRTGAESSRQKRAKSQSASPAEPLPRPLGAAS